MILNGVSLLILDEPTNHLDIPSKETLEFALNEYDGTILCVSHDRYFISSLATGILEIAPGRSDKGFMLFKGGYNAYIEETQQTAPMFAEPEPTVNSGKYTYLEAKKDKNRKRFILSRISYLEEEISDKEQRLKEIEELKNGEAATDFVLLGELYEEETAINADLDILYEELLSLEEEKEQNS